MKLSRPALLLGAPGVLAALLMVACAPVDNANSNTTATTNVTAPGASPSPAAQTLAETDRPQKIKDQMAQRGEQDTAAPVLKVVSPGEGATINGSTVNVKLNLSGDLKGYKPMKDPATGMGITSTSSSTTSRTRLTTTSTARRSNSVTSPKASTRCVSLRRVRGTRAIRTTARSRW